MLGAVRATTDRTISAVHAASALVGGAAVWSVPRSTAALTDDGMSVVAGRQGVGGVPLLVRAGGGSTA